MPASKQEREFVDHVVELMQSIGPVRMDADYSGLAEFFREAPVDRQRALWKVLAREIRLQLSEKPVWVSVAGGGIAWLHVRLDRVPKYYRYLPYTGWQSRTGRAD